jgi:integrase
MTKAEAQNALAEILRPINATKNPISERTQFGDFAKNIVLPFCRRKWKKSTCGTTEDRIRFHLIETWNDRQIGSFTRDELQNFLDTKAVKLSFSTVDHLRWDLHQIFQFAIAERVIPSNPAELLFTPCEAKRAQTRPMTKEEVNKLFSVLDLRERLIAKFALIAGMRPGEVFALTRGAVSEYHVEISQRVYRGIIDTPKTAKSVRKAAFSEGLLTDLSAWMNYMPNTGSSGWLFPSENLTSPLSRDNLWRRCSRPKLKSIGLDWVNFQVLRRTHSTLMRELNVDPKLVADQQGHAVDVNLNVYAQTPVALKKQAVDGLESALIN